MLGWDRWVRALGWKLVLIITQRRWVGNVDLKESTHVTSTSDDTSARSHHFLSQKEVRSEWKASWFKVIFKVIIHCLCLGYCYTQNGIICFLSKFIWKHLSSKKITKPYSSSSNKLLWTCCLCYFWTNIGIYSRYRAFGGEGGMKMTDCEISQLVSSMWAY